MSSLLHSLWLEISLGQFGLFADRAAPARACLVFLADGHQGMAEIQQGFGELRVFV